MEGRGRAGDACHVGRAVALTVVPKVPRRRDDPVVPADQPEVYVELLPAAQVAAAVALQAPLPDAVLAVGLPRPHHQEGPVGLVVEAHQSRHHALRLAFLAANVQVLPPVLALLERQPDGVRQGEGVPAAAPQLHPLLHQVPPAAEARLLVVHLHRHFALAARLAAGRKQLEVEPEGGLHHAEVLVALVGDQEEQAGLGRDQIIWGAKEPHMSHSCSP